MESNQYSILKVAERTLQFEYCMGGVGTYDATNSSGWRIVPQFMTAHIIDGRSILQIGTKSLVAKSNEAICILPNIHHAHIVRVRTGCSALSRWSWVNFWIFGAVSIFTLLEVPYVIRGKRAKQIGDINEELASLKKVSNPTFAHLFKERALGAVFLSVIADVSLFRPHALNFLNASHRLVPVLIYINQNLSKQLNRHELAKMASLSPSRFDGFFKSALGVAPGQYVLNIRLERSQEFLISSDFTVNEIGKKVGFQNPFHFSWIFKKHTGTSPLSYRKKMREIFSLKP